MAKVYGWMIDNATVVLYLKKARGHCFQGDVQSGILDCGLDRTALGGLICKIHSGENILADQLSCPDQILPPDPDTLTWLGGLRLAAVSC